MKLQNSSSFLARIFSNRIICFSLHMLNSVKSSAMCFEHYERRNESCWYILGYEPFRVRANAAGDALSGYLTAMVTQSPVCTALICNAKQTRNRAPINPSAHMNTRSLGTLGRDSDRGVRFWVGPHARREDVSIDLNWHNVVECADATHGTHHHSRRGHASLCLCLCHSKHSKHIS